MKKRSKIVHFIHALVFVMLIAVIFSTIGLAADFMEQRRKFREEIKFKEEAKLDKNGLYYSVIFDKDKGKYNFKVTSQDRPRIKKYLSEYYGAQDDALLDKMTDEINSGHFIIFKEYQNDGVNLKVVFLTPQAKYWEWLIDANGIEKMFHVYNFSVGLYTPGDAKMNVILQTEGEFFGISRSVTLPVQFTQDFSAKTFAFTMPSQAEITEAVKALPPLNPGRDKLEDKFIDYCRKHPSFQQKDASGKFVVTDEEIIKMLNKAVLKKDAECDVKATTGHWTIHEDYPGYMLVDYSFKTLVNMEALLPPFMKFAAGSLEKFAQVVSDEVSVKYLPLSMKNFRDFTQEWTQKGAPE